MKSVNTIRLIAKSDKKWSIYSHKKIDGKCFLVNCKKLYSDRVRNKSLCSRNIMRQQTNSACNGYQL